MSAMRAIVKPNKGKLQGIEARGPFDAIMEQVSAPNDIDYARTYGSHIPALPATSGAEPDYGVCLLLSRVRGALFSAISNAEAPMTHVIRNAVMVNRGPGGVSANLESKLAMCQVPNEESEQSQHGGLDDGGHAWPHRK